MTGTENLTISQGLIMLLDKLSEIDVTIDKDGFERECLVVLEALVRRAEEAL